MIIVGFILGFLVYKIGLIDGKRLASGGKIKLMDKPVKQTDEEKRITKGMENILNYANRRRKGEDIND